MKLTKLETLQENLLEMKDQFKNVTQIGWEKGADLAVSIVDTELEIYELSHTFEERRKR